MSQSCVLIAPFSSTVVAMHVPQQRVTVKASDVRVSNRACLASMTIQLNTPIFNDLIGKRAGEISNCGHFVSGDDCAIMMLTA